MNDVTTDEQGPQAPDYLARFGLQCDPFAAAPDPAFFCADSALTQRLDMLQNLTEFGMLVLLVIGAPGVGKTSVLQQYLQRANSNWQVCHLEADAVGNAHDLVQDLAAAFHVPGADLAHLRTLLDQMQAQGLLAVLVVDDAERLPDAVLRTLLELSDVAGETGKRLRLVLFGTEQLQDKIAALSPGHADHTHVFTIPPLSELQTAAYLHHRLKLAGMKDDAVFSPAQIRNIVKTSQGVPARINTRARQMLIDRHSVTGSSRATATAASPVRRWALFGALAAGVVLIVVALWPKPTTQNAAPSTEAGGSAIPKAEKTVELSLPKVAPSVGPATAGTTGSVSAPPSAAVVAPLPQPTLGPEVEHPVPSSPSGKIALSSVPAPELVAPAIPAAPTLHVPPATTTVTLPVGPAAPAAPAKEAVPSLTASPAALAKPTPTVKFKAMTVAPAEAKASAPAKPAAVAKAMTATATTAPAGPAMRGGAWLKGQSPGHYTLQILGSRREAAVHQFAVTNRLEAASTVLHTTRDGKAWYVLLYGAYPSRTAASQALARLPPAVRAAKPWPRSIGTVQAEIAKKP